MLYNKFVSWPKHVLHYTELLTPINKLLFVIDGLHQFTKREGKRPFHDVGIDGIILKPLSVKISFVDIDNLVQVNYPRNIYS